MTKANEQRGLPAGHWDVVIGRSDVTKAEDVRERESRGGRAYLMPKNPVDSHGMATTMMSAARTAAM